ncbi:MAG TPA: hypothetical protein VMB34_11040 [Acetobacteraceae bacterium]|nr:hypothetical protein [Acetobacteraceae bacterium]
MMGSCSVPLKLAFYDMLANDWQVLGCFMYPSHVPAWLAALVASGLLDLDMLNLRSFPLQDLEAALDSAVKLRGLDVTVLTMDAG